MCSQELTHVLAHGRAKCQGRREGTKPSSQGQHREACGLKDHVDVGVFLLPAAKTPWFGPPDAISPLQSFSRELSFLKWVIVCQK